MSDRAYEPNPWELLPRAEELRQRWLEHDWQLIREGPRPPEMHMALDEVLTYEVGRGARPATLRIWEWTQNAVILGRFQSVRNEVDPDGAAKHGVKVVRRITGGGAMFTEPQNAITYSLYAPESLVKGLSFVDSYAFMDDWVLEALRSMGVEAVYKPINDISSAQGKIGGAAQTRRGGAVLHHVMAAYDMNPATMLEVLRIGREKLSDKGSTSANKRVTPLREQTQMPRSAVLDRLVETFDRRYGLTEGAITAAELEAAERLARDKFLSDDWLYLLP
ncbi:MAG: lipoate--protein ligase family protein [Deinococcales bacterium]|nr:lipoate--protein ligase family protein [Deinococcales bacterium]